MLAAMRMVLRPEQKKMIFLMTDGDPNNEDTVKKARKLCDDIGIRIVPIAICQSSIKGFLEHEIVHVAQANDIGKALKNAVKKELFK